MCNTYVVRYSCFKSNVHYEKPCRRSHPEGARRGCCVKPTANSIGCFQGSILGSLLFNILSNDIASYIPSSVNGFRVTLIRYADDTQVAITGARERVRDMEVAMVHVLGILNNWFSQNGMMVNAAKTELMVCGDGRQITKLDPLPKVRFMGEDVHCSENVKNLGRDYGFHTVQATPRKACH